MSTYEVETVFYNNYGGVQTKSCDLFSTKNQAMKHITRKRSIHGTRRVTRQEIRGKHTTTNDIMESKQLTPTNGPPPLKGNHSKGRGKITANLCHIFLP